MPSLLAFDAAPVAEQCAELDEWRTRLDYKGPLPRTWEGRLRRDLEAEAVAASTIMEGVNVTVDEVRRILAGDPSVDVQPADRELVEGYREAMSFVLRRADDPIFRWSTELLIGLHDRILAGRHGLGAGRFRDGQRWVVNGATGEVVFLPPPAEDVPGLVEAACQQMEEMQVHPAVSAAWIHVAIAAIHPFGDGNGRAARVLASLAMHRGGFKRKEFTSLEEWWGRHLSDYYSAFSCLGKEFDPEADVTPFLEAHVNAQLTQVRALDLREQVERRLWTITEDLTSEMGLDRRVANALWDAFFGRYVTAGYYRSLTDVSAATATHDLTAAAAAGFLVAKGERRGRRYFPGPRLYEAMAQAIGLTTTVADEETARAMLVDALSKRITQTAWPRTSKPP